MATKVIMPQMGESIVEGTIIRWNKKVGDRVERDEPLFEITTDKIDTEVPSPISGLLTQILVPENQTVNVNTVVAVIDGEGEAAITETPAPREPRPETTPSPSTLAPARKAGEKIRSSPLVRRLAREHGIDLAQIPGTGEGGRISKNDIEAYLAQQRATGTGKASAPTPAQPRVGPQPVSFEGPTHVVPMTPMRSQIAQHMVASRRESAHVTTVFEVEMTRIVETQSQFGQEFERRHGLKLTYTTFFIRAVVEALKDFPILNASVDGSDIVYKKDVNVGIAVALEEGLIVPVIRRAHEKNFLELARAIQDLAERARTKRLSVEEVREGTFTVTNPGIFGGLFGTPIIHQPQVAILGVGTIVNRPVVRKDAITIRSMTYLALSFDHRIIDGAVADQFMAGVKRTLENWQEGVI